MRDAWDYTVIVANIASAFGTLAAVWAAIYIARDASRPKVRVTAYVGHVVEQGNPQGDHGRFVIIEVVNTGSRRIVVTALGWSIGWLRRRKLLQTPPRNLMSSTLPKPLDLSDSATYLVPLERFTTDAHLFRAPARAGRIRHWSARHVRIEAVLSTGERFTAPADPSIRALIAGDPPPAAVSA